MARRALERIDLWRARFIFARKYKFPKLKSALDMKRFFPLLLIAALAVSSCSLLKPAPKTPPPSTTARSAPASNDRNQNYVNQYATAAIAESQTGGVPASITLAQGILESGAGTSELATNANNHFGVKCGNNWTGKTYMKKDDDKDASGKIVESCFRKYERVEDSYLDHAAFLRDPKKQTRYGFLFQLDPTDYKGWARGLQSSGYSTSNTYADKLIDIIERYQLYQYDQPGAAGGANALPNPENPQAGAATDANIPLPNSKNRVGRVNNVRVILAREGETLTDIAKVYRLSADKLAQYNDQQYTPIQKLKVNTRVFIQAKKDKSSKVTEHTVKNNETMFDVAQLYGVKLDKILQRNRMNRAQQPAVGQRIYLNTKRPAGDEVALRDDVSSGITGQPAANMPASTTPVSLTPNEDELLDEMGGGEQNKTSTQQPPSTTTPSTTTPAATTPSSANPFSTPPATTPTTTAPATTTTPSTSTGPAVSGTAYPPSGVSSGNNSQTIDPATVPDGYHLVVKGDTLSSIARKYNTTNARIKQLNNMTDDSVKLGQVLKVK